MGPPRFLKKLYAVINSPEHPSIAWNAEGNGFVISDKAEFMAKTVTKLCKTDEYSTFVRQLNNYGFAKIKNEQTDEFINPKFRRNEPELLESLRRKNSTPEKPATGASASDLLQTLQTNQHMIHANMVHMDTLNRKLRNEVYFLKERVEHQEKTINELIRAFLTVFNTKGLEKERLQIEGIQQDEAEEGALAEGKGLAPRSSGLNILNMSPSRTEKQPPDDELDSLLNMEFDQV